MKVAAVAHFAEQADAGLSWQTCINVANVQRATVSGLQNYGIRCADGALRTGRLGSPPKSKPRTTRWSFLGVVGEVVTQTPGSRH